MYYSAEAALLRRTNKELEENFLRTEQRFHQLQKTLMSFEEGMLSTFIDESFFFIHKLHIQLSFLSYPIVLNSPYVRKAAQYENFLF